MSDRPTPRRGEEPPGDAVIHVEGLRRHFGSKVALDGATFTARAGAITGFLGPNGAGKTTAIRVLVGLDRADAGEALIFGRPFRHLAKPASRVGTLLDGSGFHPGRSARDHLLVLAAYSGVPPARVESVLQDVALTDSADRKVRGFSLGMRRRLGLASALLGDPDLLILDEPSNGLDPAGVRWLRETLRAFAARGGSVFVSSHVLAEVAQIADDVVIINGGKIVSETPIEALTTGSVVLVRSPQRDHLARILQCRGAAVTPLEGDRLEVAGTTQEAVGLAAADASVPLFELTARSHTLEDVFFRLTTEGA